MFASCVSFSYIQHLMCTQHTTKCVGRMFIYVAELKLLPYIIEAVFNILPCVILELFNGIVNYSAHF